MTEPPGRHGQSPGVAPAAAAANVQTFQAPAQAQHAEQQAQVMMQQHAQAQAQAQVQAQAEAQARSQQAQLQQQAHAESHSQVQAQASLESPANVGRPTEAGPSMQLQTHGNSAAHQNENAAAPIVSAPSINAHNDNDDVRSGQSQTQLAHQSDQNTLSSDLIDGHKIGICHATGSATNPFVFITVDQHAANEGHGRHADDIIGAQSSADCPSPSLATTGTQANTGTTQTSQGEQGNQSETDDNTHKIGICHATGSATNPFVFITVDQHAANEGHGRHADDIIGAQSAADCPSPSLATTGTEANTGTTQTTTEIVTQTQPQPAAVVPGPTTASVIPNPSSGAIVSLMENMPQPELVPVPQTFVTQIPFTFGRTPIPVGQSIQIVGLPQGFVIPPSGPFMIPQGAQLVIPQMPELGQVMLPAPLSVAPSPMALPEVQTIAAAPEIPEAMPAAIELPTVAETPELAEVAGAQTVPAEIPLAPSAEVAGVQAQVPVRQIPSTGGVNPASLIGLFAILGGAGLWLRSVKL